ncbi:MAG: hypothetical protein HYX93_04940 [Chloroflexi bacterium]|nr:hypothetical protein [Chloroflexota bacterium]
MTSSVKKVPRPKTRALLLATVFLALALWLGGSACSRGQNSLVVQLLSLPDSNQSGTATLVAQGDQTEVVIKITPASPGGEHQPAHIHYGACGPRLGQVHYPLTDVVDGASTTVVDAPLESLRDGNSNVNVHKSYPEIKTYNACGNIPPK